jgi:RHS repeat-associated protein
MMCIRKLQLADRRAAVLIALVMLTPQLATAQSETVEYYASDAIGSLRVVFNASGTVIGRMDYAPFGQELYAGLFMPAERFALLTREGEAGLDYAEARLYQSRTGRLTSSDPVFSGISDPQRWNRFSYALNNPATLTDPSGLCPECTSGYVYRETVIVRPGGGTAITTTTSAAGVGLGSEVFMGQVEMVGIGAETGGAGFWTNFITELFDTLTFSTTTSQPGTDGNVVTSTTGNTGATVAAGVAGFFLARRWPSKIGPSRQIQAAWGAGKYRHHDGLLNTLEHIVQRHGAMSGFDNVSKFAPGTSGKNIVKMVNEAIEFGQATPLSGGAIQVDYQMGRVIGTTISGTPASALRVIVQNGIIRTAYPF